MTCRRLDQLLDRIMNYFCLRHELQVAWDSILGELSDHQRVEECMYLREQLIIEIFNELGNCFEKVVSNI